MPVYEINSYNEDGSTQLGFIIADNWEDAAEALGLEPRIGDKFNNPIGAYFVMQGCPNLPYIFYLLEVEGITNQKKLAEIAQSWYEHKQTLREFCGKRRYYPPTPSGN